MSIAVLLNLNRAQTHSVLSLPSFLPSHSHKSHDQNGQVARPLACLRLLLLLERETDSSDRRTDGQTDREGESDVLMRRQLLCDALAHRTDGRGRTTGKQEQEIDGREKIGSVLAFESERPWKDRKLTPYFLCPGLTQQAGGRSYLSDDHSTTPFLPDPVTPCLLTSSLIHAMAISPSLPSYNIAIRRARQISGYAVTRLEVGRVMKYEINEI